MVVMDKLRNESSQHDPLAQTFEISEAKDGVMITKADLFFDTAGTRPILIQLVNTKDGFPSEKILSQTTIQLQMSRLLQMLQFRQL